MLSQKYLEYLAKNTGFGDYLPGMISTKPLL